MLGSSWTKLAARLIGGAMYIVVSNNFEFFMTMWSATKSVTLWALPATRRGCPQISSKFAPSITSQTQHVEVRIRIG